MDNPHGDPVTARAHHFTARYLEPILHEWSSAPQPLIHGLVKPYHISPTARTSVIVESALSRVLALILDRLNASTSSQLTVSDNRGIGLCFGGSWGSGLVASLGFHRIHPIMCIIIIIIIANSWDTLTGILFVVDIWPIFTSILTSYVMYGSFHVKSNIADDNNDNIWRVHNNAV